MMGKKKQVELVRNRQRKKADQGKGGEATDFDGNRSRSTGSKAGRATLQIEMDEKAGWREKSKKERMSRRSSARNATSTSWVHKPTHDSWQGRYGKQWKGSRIGNGRRKGNSSEKQKRTDGKEKKKSGKGHHHKRTEIKGKGATLAGNGGSGNTV